MYKKLEKLMKKKGVTAYRVAKDTGISKTSLMDYKSGKSHPKLDNLIILSKYFNVPLDYFLEKR